MPVTLDKKNPSVSLAKGGGRLQLVLNWSSHTDVDLACLYEDRSGNKGCIQALGNNFGSLDASPFVQLDRDDRSGGQETMNVNMARIGDLKRLLFFAYIYQGGDWRSVGDASVTINHPSQGSYVINLAGHRARTCALVNVDCGPDGLTVNRLEEYFKGTHEDIDRHYGWPSLNWHRSSKD